ncbi:MAG: response regulator, partial [Lentisphaerae bacterium]|nr:response regulator [Lentisphaerota bacterium]
MSAASSDSARRKSLILVVEDDRALREGLAMNLRSEGYEILTAADGEEGMRMAFDARPDL